jgi:hypothetical protein
MRCLFLGLVCVLRLEAATVSFMVIETGLPEDWGASRHAGLWESGLLDVFFEAGHIVSNAPVLRLPQKPAAQFPEEARTDLAEALEGGAEYIILALLDYETPAAGSASNPPPVGKPRNISLRVFRARPYTLLYERQFADTNSVTLKDEYDGVKSAARTLVPHINNR